MVSGTQQLGATDNKIINAINWLQFALGKSYNISIIIGRVSEEMWQVYEKQGSDLNEINSLRDKFNLNKLNPKTNFKLVKKAWGKNIINGKAAVIVIQKYGLRLKDNKDIISALEWLPKQCQDIKTDKFSNERYDVYYIGYKFKEQKEEQVIEQPVIEINNETTV